MIARDIWAMSRPEARGPSTGLSLSGLSTRDQTRDPCTTRRTALAASRPRSEGQKGQSGDKCAEETPIYRRFSAAVQAPTFEGLLVHLRSLISQLEAAEIPCNYAQLAADLFTWQDPRHRTSVMRNWGRQFARPADITRTDPASDE